MTVIGVLLGSSRNDGNGVGLLSWLLPFVQSTVSADPDNFQPEIKLVNFLEHPHPLGPIVNEMPASVRDPTLYTSPRTRDWSAFVSSCAAFIVLTPQHNWGYPGELKNALDRLYWEWQAKPVLLITYGGHGGGKCAAQLREVMEGGLKMKVVSSVEITLPREYISGAKRVQRKVAETPNSMKESDDFLEKYNEPTKEAVREFLAVVNPSS